MGNVVLSALANASSSDAGKIEQAFQTGTPHLEAKAAGLQLLPRAECGARTTGSRARPPCSGRDANPKEFNRIMRADRRRGRFDQEREAELLRAIADTLDCPIPPFVAMAES